MAKSQKQTAQTVVAAAPAVRRWKLKPKAPKHYIQGQGTKEAGDEFTWPTKVSDWCEEVAAPGVVAAAASQEQEQDKGAAPAAPESDPPADAGTF